MRDKGRLSVNISVLVHENGPAGVFDYLNGLLEMLKVRHFEQSPAPRTGYPPVGRSRGELQYLAASRAFGKYLHRKIS